jgi:hypothetical protein
MGDVTYVSHIPELIARMEAAKLAAHKAMAETAKDLAVDRTPKDTGTLRASANTGANNDHGEIAFDTDYAIPVHERLDAHHPVGQAHFLSSVLSGPDAAIVLAAGAEAFKAALDV